MGNLQFKRGLKNNLPTTAASGTPLWCTDTKELYIGTGTGVEKVGSSESDNPSSVNQISDFIDDTSTNPIDKANTLTGLTATITELNYCDGVTSNIQTQLNNKQPSGSYLTTTGTAARATADSNGNTITSTYELISKNIISLSSSGTISLSDNSIHKITPSGTVTFSLPSISDISKFHQILVQLNMPTVRTINLGTSYFFDCKAPDLSVAGIYNIIYEYDAISSMWVCGAISKGVAE